ncbi:MAG: nucleotidyltransferase domain-containing protein [bacterium]|nr:nucleotidyltransferase domain-containing protein [bacterium]
MHISGQQERDLTGVAEKHGLRLIVAFGSRATGKGRPESDLDLAVLPSSGAEVPIRVLGDLIADLAGIFPGVEVDVSLIPRADPLFLKKIFETGVLLHGDEVEFRRYRVYAFRRYSEYLPYLRIEEAATRRLVERLRRAD